MSTRKKQSNVKSDQLAQGFIQGRPARLVTSMTRFYWTPEQTAKFTVFLHEEDLQSSSQQRRKRFADVSRLVASLGYASFTGALNDQNKDLGPIIEAKVRRKLFNIARSLHEHINDHGIYLSSYRDDCTDADDSGENLLDEISSTATQQRTRSRPGEHDIYEVPSSDDNEDNDSSRKQSDRRLVGPRHPNLALAYCSYRATHREPGT